MCLKAKVPLVESGTEGFAGQCFTIIPWTTACYDCWAPPTRRKIAFCTVRSRPSSFEDCVFWAKQFFMSLFTKTDSSFFFGEIFKKCDFDLLFKKIFIDDIKKLTNKNDENIHLLEEIPSCKTFVLPLQIDWNIIYNFEDKLSILRTLYGDMLENDKINDFDKDDQKSMLFVYALANCRAYIFGIKEESLWETKSIAGTIIPAIPTSNAIIAALALQLANSILHEEPNSRRYIRLQKYYENNPHILRIGPDQRQNKNCHCRNTFVDINIGCDFSKTTFALLGEFIRKNRQLRDVEIFFNELIYVNFGDLDDDEWKMITCEETFNMLGFKNKEFFEVYNDTKEQRFGLFIHQQKTGNIKFI